MYMLARRMYRPIFYECYSTDLFMNVYRPILQMYRPIL